jgi:hypothetical protein
VERDIARQIREAFLAAGPPSTEHGANQR